MKLRIIQIKFVFKIEGCYVFSRETKKSGKIVLVCFLQVKLSQVSIEYLILLITVDQICSSCKGIIIITWFLNQMSWTYFKHLISILVCKLYDKLSSHRHLFLFDRIWIHLYSQFLRSFFEWSCLLVDVVRCTFILIKPQLKVLLFLIIIIVISLFSIWIKHVLIQFYIGYCIYTFLFVSELIRWWDMVLVVSTLHTFYT